MKTTDRIVAWKELECNKKRRKKNLYPFYTWTCYQRCKFLQCWPDAKGKVGGESCPVCGCLNPVREQPLEKSLFGPAS